MARSFSQEARSDSHKIGEMRYRMSHLPSTTAIARTLLLAGILLAVAVLASRSFFPAFAHDITGDVEHIHLEHDEKDDSQVAAFAATDEDDGDEITWSLVTDNNNTSPDHDDFDISQDGVLTFKNTPNYEAPTGTGGTREEQNSYTVIVVAKDDDDMPAMDMETVTVMVKNIDEPGMIELSTLQPKEGRPITATLTDPDEQRDTADDADDTIISDDTRDDPRRHTWQWARCSTTDVATCVDIEENSTSTSYTATSTDRGHYLRVTAKYADKQTLAPEAGEDLDLNKTAHGMSAHPVVRSDYVPEPPLFPGQDEELSSDSNSRETAATTSRDIAENSAAGTAVGAPVRAMDEGFDGNQEVLTYTLSGNDDDGNYRIDSSSGQIRVGATANLNHEANETDTVTVRATDPTDKVSEVEVTINITDVDEDPSITDRSSDQTTIVRQESETGLTVGDAHEATDPEDDDDTSVSLTYSLSGTDRARFDISDSGQVSFLVAPDFEAPADSGRNNVYNFNVVVTDSGDNTDSLPVTVTINNTDEGGNLVVLFNGLTPDTPVQEARVGTTIRAKLTDPDGVSNVRYEWRKGGQPIAGATSATYRPATTTGGILSVAVTYDDPHANGIDDLSEIIGTVSDRQANTDGPEIQEPVSPVEVAENNAGSLSQTLTVDDANDSNHSWAITGGRDRSLFDIVQISGALTLKSGVELDHETKPTLQVTLRATDPSAASDSFTLTVNVTNVEEDPEIISSPDSPVTYREDQTGPVGTFTATDDEDDSARSRLPLTWSVTSDTIFSIDNRGVLRFINQPDFEGGGAVTHILTITVTDNTEGGGRTDTASLTVNIDNVDEPGEVKLDALAPKRDFELTATLTDPDGNIANQQWTWSNSTSRTGPSATSTATAATSTTGSNTANYTPNDDDVGKYLRALVTYTDAQSSGTPPSTKTAQIVSTHVVRDVDYANTAPIFPGQEMDDTPAGDSRPTGSNATTSREIAENSPSGTNVGARVEAKDLDENRRQQVLTYTIGASTADGALATDDDLFSIDRATGQITVTTDDTLNYEDATNPDHMYVVLVTATDPSDLASSIDVTIMVKDLKEAPEIADAMGDDNVASTSTPENTAENTATTTVLSTYTASDDEDGAADPEKILKWSLSGADADMFSLCEGDDIACNEPTNTVSLRFKQATNFEKPADSGNNNVYDVIVTVTDNDAEMPQSDSRSVAVTVTNAEEAGTVTLSNRQPEVDVAIRATLSDLDGGETGVTWKWEFSDLLE